LYISAVSKTAKRTLMLLKRYGYRFRDLAVLFFSSSELLRRYCALGFRRLRNAARDGQTHFASPCLTKLGLIALEQEIQT
jgi:hypothetical protein